MRTPRQGGGNRLALAKVNIQARVMVDAPSGGVMNVVTTGNEAVTLRNLAIPIPRLTRATLMGSADESA
jgi:hypothetical protein